MAITEVQVRLLNAGQLAAAVTGKNGPLLQKLLALGFKIEAQAKTLTNNQMVGVVTGRLSGSITTVAAEIDGMPAVLVGTPVNYAMYVHEGTRPHWPPRDPIARWLALRGGNPKDAWRVQAAIARRGTRPRPFLTTAMRNVLG